ncbi:helix-turn-helix transcriptional regulator [Streptomyces sp. NPDC041068]|uniref:AraC family transcriptional regulator n=1 Tax=Streptomyces sp. NPDC041068 TaxID=3155130 RepID=UPI0033E71A67
MVGENGQFTESGGISGGGIVDVAYRNPHCPALGIDVDSLSAVRHRTSPRQLAAPQRLDFHLLVLVTAGRGDHMVDFIDHACARGTLLWIRPGQVHRYAPEPGLQARLVLFTPDFPPRLRIQALLDDPFGPAHWDLAPAALRELTAFTDLLVAGHDQHEAGPPEPAGDLLRHLLTALLLRISLLPEPEGELPPPGPGELFTRFRAQLETSFASEHSVNAYASRLATTPKTLTRACLEATGRSAKAVIDARVALEAKRLLAHTDLTAAAVGRRLGFSEATNFAKFFARTTGHSPGDFRAALGVERSR